LRATTRRIRLRAPQHEATGCCHRGQSRDRQGRRRGISFDAYCERLGNPDFISAEEPADIIVFCWKEPQRICIRDIVVMPATSSFA